MQQIYNPIDYCFKWTDDDRMYEWDRTEAHKQARAARNKRAKELRAKGKHVTSFSLSGQLISRGGIGSGNPHCDFIVTAYGLNVY